MTPLPSLRQLRHLVALAEERHFGKAAALCHVTQSTLSASIKELEDRLQAALVERNKRSVVLTPLGAETVARAREILRETEELARAAEAAGEPLGGILRMGVIPTIGPFLLPRVFAKLRRSHPRLRLYLREDLTDRLVERLQAGELDLVLLALPHEAGNLETEALFADPFSFCCPADHPLAHSRHVTAAALGQENLLLLEDGHCLRQHALNACGLRGASHVDPFQATSLHTIVQMVDNGLGVSLLPRLAIETGITKGTSLRVIPLEGKAPAREIGLAWRRKSARREEFRLLGRELKRLAGHG